jgi:hypothetical protein
MKIPTINEVEEYMGNKKKEWPKKFIEYYAEKFWNFYTSKGWKVGSEAMKNWQSAFCSQWQNLKYGEDLGMMDKCMVLERRKRMTEKKEQAKIIQIPSIDRTVEYIDEIMHEFQQHPSNFPQKRLASCYDWLKEHKFMKLTKEQFDLAVQAGSENIEKGKALATEFVFHKMMLDCKTFKDLARVTA